MVIVCGGTYYTVLGVGGNCWSQMVTVLSRVECRYGIDEWLEGWTDGWIDWPVLVRYCTGIHEEIAAFFEYGVFCGWHFAVGLSHYVQQALYRAVLYSTSTITVERRRANESINKTKNTTTT